MLTTIQESVTVDHNGLIQLHVPNFEYNSRLSVVAVIEKEDLSKKEEASHNNLSHFFEMAGQVDIDSDAIDVLREKSLI